MMDMNDPRLAAVIAIAAQAAPAISPTGSRVVGTVSALLQAATALQTAYQAGSYTDADLATMVAKAEVKLAIFEAEVAAGRTEGGAA